jgi:phosphoglycolate phosphatase
VGKVKEYELYVFDLDGTIADTRADLKTALAEAVKAAGFPEPAEENVIAAVGRGALKAIEKLTGMDEEQAEKYLGIFRETYEKVCCDNVTLFPGVKEFLYGLKEHGKKTALVTMKYRVPTIKILSRLGIDIFDEVTAFEDTEKRKPDPESFLKLFNKYGIGPDRALMVGDSITDIRYAKAAGADVCIMLYGYGDKKEMLAAKPQYLLNGFQEF